MKVIKISLITIGAVVLLFIIVSGVYLLINIQGEVESFEVNSPEMAQKVLIASQGSDFKNALVESIAVYMAKKPVYIKVLDVTALDDVNEGEWNAVVLIHTTEGRRLQRNVKEYLDRAEDLNKIILLTTSGSGKWKTEDYDIDVITSASKKEKLPLLISEILTRLGLILKKENL